MRRFCPALAALFLAASPAFAEVTRLEIASQAAHASGAPQDTRGPYVYFTGTAHFALDPKLPANQSVVDLSFAPTNKDGKVAFQADVEIYAPKDLAKCNGAIFYDVNNRGNRFVAANIQGGADDFLLRRGFIIVRSAWIAEILPDTPLLHMTAPVATQNGAPITGPVRAEITTDTPQTKLALSSRGRMGSSRPTARGLKEATLTMREREGDKRQVVPREQWSLTVTEVLYNKQPWPLPLVELDLPAGFKPGWLYEVIYEAQNPVVQGVGLAGIRDLVSFLRYDTSDGNPLRLPATKKPAASRTLAFGISQSGRCLRQFVYDGFNADEQGRQVFDGVMPHVAGGGLGSFNHRFASPTRTNTQHDDHLYAADMFPFAYGDATDPFTRATDGILRQARASKTVPKVFHTQSSSEYWHRAGSLVHTTPDGTKDADVPAEVRIYTFGGCNHGAGTGIPKPATGGTLPPSPADYRPLMRGLVLALDAWVRDGTEPPASVYPRIADGTLVDWKKESSGWPAVTNVAYPQVIHTPPFLDRGPDWPTHRIATIEPPAVRGHYGVRVPAFDLDGNERGTLQPPAVRVPIASYTGWNLRNDTKGAAGELASLSGGYIPFPRTAAEGQAAGDPRRALLDRYPTFADFQRQYQAAADELARNRYLLAEDLPRLKALCEKSEPSFKPAP